MNLHEHLQHLRGLDDDGLLRSLKRHLGSSNRLNALVLAHLAEVDARGAYRHWACETLTAYCVYELRFSEDEAQRRCRAARVARQFPILFEMLADASIHLTGILLLAPHLTGENHIELCARARYRRKSEIERLIAELAPARDVPALVEPLGAAVDAAAPARAKSTWAALVEGRAGWVRQLEPGDGPAHAPSAPDDWHEELVAALEDGQGAAPARTLSCEGDVAAPARAASSDDGSAPPLAAGNVRSPLRYKVQFTADQAYVDLLEQARDLLWHRLPNGDLAQLQRLALEALVENLMRRKHAGAVRSEPTSALSTQTSPSDDVSTAVSTPAPMAPREQGTDAPARTTPSLGDVAAPARTTPSDDGDDAKSGANVAAAPVLRSRHIPAAVRRSVWQRDGGRCSFVDARGVRCRATRAIEFHHEHPYARGGPHSVENITLRCRSHNELAAEGDFGRAFARGVKHAHHDI